MFPKKCNIDKADRTNRIIIGLIILIALAIGIGKWFFTIIGLVLIFEGLVGWCGIPILAQKIKHHFSKNGPKNTQDDTQ